MFLGDIDGNGADTNSEGKRYAAADRARGLDQVDRLAVLAEHGNVALRQEVAQVDEGFHVATHDRNRLADKDVQEGIALSGRSVEHINGSDRRSIHPAVGGDPAGVGARHDAAELGGEGVAALCSD